MKILMTLLKDSSLYFLCFKVHVDRLADWKWLENFKARKVRNKLVEKRAQFCLILMIPTSSPISGSTSMYYSRNTTKMPYLRPIFDLNKQEGVQNYAPQLCVKVTKIVC